MSVLVGEYVKGVASVAPASGRFVGYTDSPLAFRSQFRAYTIGVKGFVVWPVV
jgi:hypothetical protein